MECYVKLYERKLQLFPEKHAKLSLNGICMWDEGVLFICSYSTIKLCPIAMFCYYKLFQTHGMIDILEKNILIFLDIFIKRHLVPN